MTSKEALEEIKGIHLVEYDEDGEETDTQTLLQYAGKSIFEPIEKDLGILDIFKNIIKVIPNTKYSSGPKYYLCLRQDVIANDKTIEIIKEWLDNDL